MGRTVPAIPSTSLKRGVYYFLGRIPSDLSTFYRNDRVIELAYQVLAQSLLCVKETVLTIG